MKKTILLLLLCNVLAAQDTITITKTLEDVVVDASAVRMPNNTTCELNHSQLNVNNVGQQLPYILAYTPSLVVTSDDGLGVGYTYFRLRGTDHTRLSMTINGVPLNDSESQTVFWVNMADVASSMNVLQVHRGVAEAVNGSVDFGGSISLSSFEKMPQDTAWHWKISFNGGMYATFRELMSVRKAFFKNDDAWNLAIRISKVDSKGYIERAKSDLFSYQAHLQWERRANSFDLFAFGGKEKTYMAWDGVTREQINKNRRFNPAGLYLDANGDTAYYKNQNDNYQQHHVQLHNNYKLNARWHLNATAHYTYGEGNYEQLIERRVRQKHLQNHFFGAMAQAKFLCEIATMELGTAANHYTGQHFGTWANFNLATQTADYASMYEFYRAKGDKTEASVFAKSNVRVWQKAQNTLELFANVQYRLVNHQIMGDNEVNLQEIRFRKRLNFVNPKAGINFQHRRQLFYAHFAMAHREPTYDNYTQAGDNEKPHHETLYDYEMGVKLNAKKTQMEVNAYYMYYDNQLVLTGKYSDVGAFLTKNVKNSYRMGIEISFATQWLKFLHWNGNITLSQNKIRHFADWIDVFDADGNWIEQQKIDYGTTTIAFAPAITANNILLFTARNFRAEVATTVVGRQFLDNTQNRAAQLKAYSTTNLNVAYTIPQKNWRPTMRFFLQVNNLFNVRYESNGGNYTYRLAEQMCVSPWFYPQATINTHAGISIEM